MRYAVVSDIHSNIQAWDAVYQDICENSIDEIICLGDVVGYGPNPADVFDACYATIHHIVMGNHDAAVCGKMVLDRFNDHSRKIIEWTQSQLDPSVINFFTQLPLIIGGDNAVFTHACVDHPANFDYIYEAKDCLRSWNACAEQVIFFGHTHMPSVHMIGEMGIPQSMPAKDIRLSQNIRYMVNVGSVGQPRDGDVRASYLIYDSEHQSFSFRRVDYDVDAYFRSLKMAGLPVHPSMVGDALQGQRYNDFNPASMPQVMGQERPQGQPRDTGLSELDQRVERLSDRRNNDNDERQPGKPVRKLKASGLKAAGARTGTLRAGTSATRTGTGAMRPGNGHRRSSTGMRVDATRKQKRGGTQHDIKPGTLQKHPQKMDSTIKLCLILGLIMLLGIVAGIIVIAVNLKS